MITEDYVSFEVAKLLKDKGFDIICDKIYRINGYLCPLAYSMNIKEEGYYLAPTHQMACKWLREEKKLVISIDLNYSDNSYSYMIDSIIDHRIVGHGLGETYEEAVEAALKYTLENLI